MTPGGGRQLIPPSLSDLSLKSAGSGNSWQSASSASSRKRSLELAFDGSPQPKRRLLAEMAIAANAFRYSAPCAQPGLGVEGPQRRGGLLKRSGAPIQSLLSKDGRPPPITSRFGLEYAIEPGAGRHDMSPDVCCPHPRPSRKATVPSAPTDYREVRKWKGHAFWRLTSQPIMEYPIPEARRGEQMPVAEKGPFPKPNIGRPLSGIRTNANQLAPSVSARPHAEAEPRRMVGATKVEDGGGARLQALHTLEGVRNEQSGQKLPDGGGLEIRCPSKEKPITMCGERLYADWQGDWGRSSP